MSRRAAVIEEVDDDEFDDDTDLPLPPLPNTGAQGPLLQEFNEPPPRSPWPASPRPPARPEQQSQGETSASGENVTIDPITGKKTIWIQDGSAYKMWTSIYPIYLDAKRPYSGSERRISREKSVWWPLSNDIVDACGYIGFKTLHEPTKRHPRDWENPGRVKVCFKIDGRLQNPRIKTKKQLLEAIANRIQQNNPDLVPRPPAADVGAPAPTTVPPPATESDPKPSSNKKDKAKTSASLRTAPSPKRKTKSSLLQPPSGPPRVSPFSPAQEANILIETVKAGMNVPVPGEGGPAGPAAIGGKGKRKVVRVRQ